MRTIVEEWEKYKEATCENADDATVLAVQRAFYCGYWSSLNLACDISLDASLSPVARQHILAGLLTEALDFTRQVINLQPHLR